LRASIILPLAVQAGAACWLGVEDAGDVVLGVALGPVLEVADGDAAVQPLTASNKAALASVPAKRSECRRS
jgi:hypothetical protein